MELQNVIIVKSFISEPKEPYRYPEFKRLINIILNF